jgi:hypothetical protein
MAMPGSVRGSSGGRSVPRLYHLSHARHPSDTAPALRASEALPSNPLRGGSVRRRIGDAVEEHHRGAARPVQMSGRAVNARPRAMAATGGVAPCETPPITSATATRPRSTTAATAPASAPAAAAAGSSTPPSSARPRARRERLAEMPPWQRATDAYEDARRPLASCRRQRHALRLHHAARRRRPRLLRGAHSTRRPQWPRRRRDRHRLLGGSAGKVLPPVAREARAHRRRAGGPAIGLPFGAAARAGGVAGVGTLPRDPRRGRATRW